ncbi:hypothetical protein J2X53_003479 [Pseudorhodobacter sp. 4114]|nr:hypothetical protein [Pseudorhodobacter sp. 4114]
MFARLARRLRAEAVTARSDDLSIIAPTDKTLLVLMLEIEPENLRPAVEKLIARFPKFRVVFLHTMIDFRPFMDAHAVFERLPALNEIGQFPDLLDWPAFLADRQALLFAKWRPERIIRYGIDLEEYSASAASLWSGGRDAG